MNNKILLVHTCMGPTFRNRLISNITHNINSYLLYDNLILTDNLDQFNIFTSYPNIKVKDINTIRKNTPWSIKLEPTPLKTNNESEYANFILNNNFCIPSLFRFSLLEKNIKDYDSIIFLNCDVICTTDQNQYNNILSFLNKYDHDFVIGNHHFNFNSLKSELDIISKKLNFPYSNFNLNSNDGNFFMYCFKNKNKIKDFLKLYNDIVYEVLNNKNKKLYKLGKHSNWKIQSEGIQAIIHTLLNIKVYPNNAILKKSFKINTYPEDRFWNWPTIFKTNNISKKYFIEENKELLKQFYKQKNQPWLYN